ncbi:hypothetical protein AB0C90_35505 [Streptomyces sp. NPDC048550]
MANTCAKAWPTPIVVSGATNPLFVLAALMLPRRTSLGLLGRRL